MRNAKEEKIRWVRATIKAMLIWSRIEKYFFHFVVIKPLILVMYISIVLKEKLKGKKHEIPGTVRPTSAKISSSIQRRRRFREFQRGTNKS